MSMDFRIRMHPFPVSNGSNSEPTLGILLISPTYKLTYPFGHLDRKDPLFRAVTQHLVLDTLLQLRAVLPLISRRTSKSFSSRQPFSNFSRYSSGLCTSYCIPFTLSSLETGFSALLATPFPAQVRSRSQQVSGPSAERNPGWDTATPARTNYKFEAKCSMASCTSAAASGLTTARIFGATSWKYSLSKVPAA